MTQTIRDADRLALLFCVYLRPSADHLANHVGLLYEVVENGPLVRRILLQSPICLSGSYTKKPKRLR